MISHHRKEIEDLIVRHLENNCTNEEKQRLNELLLVPGNELLIKEILLSQLSEYPEAPQEAQHVDFDRIFSQLLAQINHRETLETEKRLLHKGYNAGKVSRLVLAGISIAAVLCIVFYLGMLFKSEKKTGESILPVLAAYNEIKAPMGGKSEIKLSDGTEIMLNAGSSIKYSRDYNLANRDLILDGEAYFKVAKNKKLPLIVRTGDLNIKATGTEFNIKAYSDEDFIETTLIEGEVEVLQKGSTEKDQVLILKPNQKVIYSSKSDQVTLERIKEIEPMAVKPSKDITDRLLVSHQADIDQVTAWTKNRLIIKSENLESLCIKLQRKYGVNFVFGDEEIKKFRFSGVLHDETFEQIMDVIKLTAPINYSIDGKTVELVMDKKQLEKYSGKTNE